MISFLAKLLQNPTFVRQLKLHREQEEIHSTRVKRKFLKHVPHGSMESGEPSSQHTEEGGSHFPASSPMAVQDDIEDLQNFLLEDDEINFYMDPKTIGLEESRHRKMFVRLIRTPSKHQEAMFACFVDSYHNLLGKSFTAGFLP